MSNSALKIIKHPEANPGFDVAVQLSELNVWAGDQHILNKINLAIANKQITCLIGPSGSGKSTLLRSLNRMHDNQPSINVSGKIYFQGKNILDAAIDTPSLRSEIGMVFQKPCVFPTSIAENVLFGIKQKRKISQLEGLEIIEKHLKDVSLWSEVSHRLDDKASTLSLGQQQRLCIARSLVMNPKILLMDEPTSSLDPTSSKAIEALCHKIKGQTTILFVTHNIPQAKRIADQLIFMCAGEIIETGDKTSIFTQAEKEETRRYLNDEFCAC